MRRLVLLCPSVEDFSRRQPFTTAPCEESRCTFWACGCTAGLEIAELYAVHLDKHPLPDCHKARPNVCRWHSDAMNRKDPGCPVRRLGMVCAHAGGEWETFQMVPPEEWGEIGP
jgi:hypothetical protein